MIYGQKESEIIVKGRVYNMETLDSLPFSHIIINNKNHVLSDANACFKIKVSGSDTIVISNVGFYDSKIFVSELLKTSDTMHLDVVMKVKVYDLEEVDVTSYKTYEEFKLAVLRDIGKSIGTKEYNNAQKNIKIMKEHIKNDYVQPVNDNFIYQSLSSFKSFDNHSLIFFSSGPNKGLIPTLKKLFGRK